MEKERQGPSKLRTLLLADDRWSSRLRIAERAGLLRHLAAFVAHSGDSWFWGIGLGIVWILGNRETKSWSLHLIAAIVVTAIVVMSIKLVVRRQRPSGEWGAIYRNTDPHSFPSGHAARAILLAMLVWGMGPVWFAITLTFWGPLVALARVAMGVHYLSDVFAGGILGLIIGSLWLILLI
jgi:undecaprenyl-diphosphatase